MSCIKTGCHCFLAPHGMWAYGDAFEMFGVTYFRFCEVSMKPLAPVKHFTIKDWEQWFDEGKTSQAQNSTMIVGPYECENHGYEGVPL